MYSQISAQVHTNQKNKTFQEILKTLLRWMPEVFSLASSEELLSDRVVLVGKRPLAQAVKSFECTDPITLSIISPESRFDPGNLIGRLEKRFSKGLLLVKCTMILANENFWNVYSFVKMKLEKITAKPQH